VKLADYRLRITDGPNTYMQFKDVFVRGVYRFACERHDPLIIDGGSNMGMSILGFKQDHPGCRVISFEPDPELARLLKENLERNSCLDNVRLEMAGLGSRDGMEPFAADGSAGGKFESAATDQAVQVVRLSGYLTEPVDFLKLNIEGEELTVLRECAAADALSHVQKMVVEYHGWTRGPQRLGELLNLLDHHGFRYLVHDFDSETCSTSKPPFRWRSHVPWFCLVYAERVSRA